MDENVLFGDTSSITDSATLATRNRSGKDSAEAGGKTVSFSGDITAVSQGGLTRDYFDSPDWDESHVDNAVLADMSLDVRLLRDYKAFTEVELSYSPAGAALAADSGTTVRVPEMFLDANVRHRAYFRLGKQVLQWGRNAFFNPTDLINIDRVTFFRRISSREGVYGAKVHVPFGTAWNLYGFLDGQGVTRPDSLAAAFRAERLWGRTEMSAMIWGRGNQAPVYGLDLSTRLFTLDVTGEAALYQEFEARSLSFTSSGFPVVDTRTEEWEPRMAFGIGRFFRISGIRDRLHLLGEYYYNAPGNTDDNMGFAPMLAALPGSGLTGQQGLSILATSGLYVPNSYSRHYAALFATFSRFFRESLTLTFNTIGNLNQSCALLTTGITYQDLNDFNLSVLVNGFIGPDDTEYTLAGEGLQLQIIAASRFLTRMSQ